MKGVMGLRKFATVLALATATSCGSFPIPEPVPPPSGARADYVQVQSCVVDLSETRGLRSIVAHRDPVSGSLFVLEGRRYRPIAERYPATRQAGYAAAEAWFQKDEAIRQYGRRYVKEGPLRVVPPASLTLGAPHNGVPVFLNREDIERPAALYVPVRPGCFFQPYVVERAARS